MILLTAISTQIAPQIPSQVATQLPSQSPSIMQGAPAAQQLQLQDIHLPEQINSFPIALGWWLLAAIIIMITVYLFKKLKHNKQLNRNRNHALTVLEKQTSLTNSDLIALLKWASMQYFDRFQVANLFGDSFQKFLIEQLPENHQESFKALSKQAFVTQYHENSILSASEESTVINNDCRDAVKLWLTHALPPKSQNQNQNQSNTNKNGGLAYD